MRIQILVRGRILGEVLQTCPKPFKTYFTVKLIKKNFCWKERKREREGRRRKGSFEAVGLAGSRPPASTPLMPASLSAESLSYPVFTPSASSLPSSLPLIHLSTVASFQILAPRYVAQRWSIIPQCVCRPSPYSEN